MNTSVIRYRVADFLKRYAPFDALPEDELLELAGSGRVRFHESEELVFEQGRARNDFVWIIQQGRVSLLANSGGRERLLDVLSEGDMLGLDRFAGHERYATTARTETDVILYAVSGTLFETLAARHPAMERFLAAHFSAADTDGFGRTSWLDAAAPPVEFIRARSVGDAARLPRIPEPATTRGAVQAMLTARSAAVAVGDSVLSADDLALFCGANPVRIAAAIREASSATELATLLPLAHSLILGALGRPHDAEDCCRINSEVLAETAETAIRLAHAEVPATPACWIMFGPAARGDLLRPAPPALAVVYDDETATPAFTELAAGLNAPESLWPSGAQPAMTLSQWRSFYSETIRNPIAHDLYGRRDFFDMRALSGDAALAGALRDHIVGELNADDMVVSVMAIDTLSHVPPLTFLDGMVVADDGERQETFDIFESVTRPIADAARVFALAQRRMMPAHTLDRLATAALEYPGSASVFHEAAEAFCAGLFYQALAGSSQIAPARLRRYDLRLIKTAFASVQRLLDLTIATFIHKTQGAAR